MQFTTLTVLAVLFTLTNIAITILLLQKIDNKRHVGT